MKITKMQGLGNDYIYVNCLEETVADPAALARKISDRHFGVGSDGLVLIMPCDEADFRMRMYNADGSEAEMCGNASLCVGKYIHDRGLSYKTEISLMTGAGIKILKLTVKDGEASMTFAQFVAGKHSVPIWLHRDGMQPIPGVPTFG